MWVCLHNVFLCVAVLCVCVSAFVCYVCYPMVPCACVHKLVCGKYPCVCTSVSVCVCVCVPLCLWVSLCVCMSV